MGTDGGRRLGGVGRVQAEAGLKVGDEGLEFDDAFGLGVQKGDDLGWERGEQVQG